MQRNLKIFFTSDIHGYFSCTDYASNQKVNSGLASCASAFSKDSNTLIIDGGDTIQGSPFTYWLYDRATDKEYVPARIMNLPTKVWLPTGC